MSWDDLRKHAIAVRGGGTFLVREDSGPALFPGLCANCVAPNAQPVFVERAFRMLLDVGEDGWQTVHPVISFSVPFCAACLQRHHGERKRASPWLWVKRLFAGSGEALGGAVVVVVGFFFLKEALLHFSLVLLVFSCLPLGIGGYLLRKNWKENSHMAVAPDTSVFEAVEFTPVLSETHEPMWRAFRFRNSWYAEQFRLMNADRLWDPRGREAQAASEKRRQQDRRLLWIAGPILGAVALWALWDEFGREFAQVLRRWLRI